MASMRRWTQLVVLALVLGLGALGAGTVAGSAPTFSECTSDSLLTSNTFVSIADPLSPSQACCKVCSKGQACGDSCIARTSTCHKPPGCACDE